MDLAELFKVVVPLIVLGVWALSFLFHKEAPVPPGRPGGPPRRMMPPEMEVDLDGIPAGRGRPGAPFEPTRPNSTAWRPPYSSGNDDILVIGSDPGPTTLNRPRPSGGSSGRRSGRSRGGSGSSATSKRPKPEAARPLPSGLSELAPSAPLSKPSESFVPLQVDLTQSAPHSTTAKSGLASAIVINQKSTIDPAITNLAETLRSPTRVRELMIGQMILGPPAALRRRR